MNPSTAPANNETVAYGQLLASAGKLKRNDQVNLVKALAGTLGMIAVFPNQLAGNSAPPPKGEKKKKEKGPAKQAPSNPLSGTPEKKAFDAAKKAVAKATKDNGGQKLAEDHELVEALEEAKDQYFRSLSAAKGSNAEAPSKAASAQAPSGASASATKSPTPKPAPQKGAASSPPKK